MTTVDNADYLRRAEALLKGLEIAQQDKLATRQRLDAEISDLYSQILSMRGVVSGLLIAAGKEPLANVLPHEI